MVLQMALPGVGNTAADGGSGGGREFYNCLEKSCSEESREVGSCHVREGGGKGAVWRLGFDRERAADTQK